MQVIYLIILKITNLNNYLIMQVLTEGKRSYFPIHHGPVFLNSKSIQKKRKSTVVYLFPMHKKE